MRRLIRISIGGFVLAVTLFLLLIAASIYSFHQLTDETLIAEVRFDRVGAQSYTAHLLTGDFCTERQLGVLGDQWRIDARFLKWHYWASLLGLDSQYRLERFEGRYRSINEQNARPSRAYAIGDETALDLVALAEGLGRLNFLVDATYGSSTYEDIATDRVYLVYKSPTGLFLRTRPREATLEPRDALAVEVRRGCGEGEGVLERVAGWANEALLRVI